MIISDENKLTSVCTRGWRISLPTAVNVGFSHSNQGDDGGSAGQKPSAPFLLSADQNLLVVMALLMTGEEAAWLLSGTRV